MREIITINKPRGYTPLQAINRFRECYPSYADEKISYAGRLDPMADGLLILLVGDANKERASFEDLEKTYEFSFLLGVQTDTYDILGRITHIHHVPRIDVAKLSKTLSNFIGTDDQPYPPFSSMSVNGRPLFYWAREKRLAEIDIPTKRVTIKSLAITKMTPVTQAEILPDILQDIQRVHGNFRQDAILEDWQTKLPPDWTTTLITCEAAVSSGTYIRSLVHSVGKAIGCGATTFSITRVQVGDMSLNDAIRLPLQ